MTCSYLGAESETRVQIVFDWAKKTSMLEESTPPCMQTPASYRRSTGESRHLSSSDGNPTRIMNGRICKTFHGLQG